MNRAILSRAIEMAHGNQAKAARWLGISRLTLREKLILFGLHPGQGPLHERTAFLRSWQGILSHPESPRVRCVDEWVVGRAGLAIVVCREILANGQLMATNTYARTSEGWRMVGHHSGPVPAVERQTTASSATAPLPDRRKLH